jgi:hypothetical protein
LQLIQSGSDPLEEERKRKAEPTIKALAGEWLDRHASGLKSEKSKRKHSYSCVRRPKTIALKVIG